MALRWEVLPARPGKIWSDSPDSGKKNSGYFQKSETAGYYIDTLDQPNAPYFVVITSGKKRTSGYGIEVTGIDLDEACTAGI